MRIKILATLPLLLIAFQPPTYATPDLHNTVEPFFIEKKQVFPDYRDNYQKTIVEPQRAAQAALEAQVVIYTPPVVLPVMQAPGDIQAIIVHWAGIEGADANQLLRVAACESGFNIYAHNPSGATGLFQFMPSTFYGNGGTNLYDANDQSRVAATMFAHGQAGQWVCK